MENTLLFRRKSSVSLTLTQQGSVISPSTLTQDLTVLVANTYIY